VVDGALDRPGKSLGYRMEAAATLDISSCGVCVTGSALAFGGDAEEQLPCSTEGERHITRIISSFLTISPIGRVEE
jgi:hypothetical protein